MLPLREIDIMGMLVAPFALCLPLALIATVATLALLRRIPGITSLARWPLLKLGVFTALLSSLVLMLGRV